MKKPNSVSIFSSCFGCGVCALTCPTRAISMGEEHGFWKPIIDNSLCVQCGKCLKTCSFDNPIPHLERCSIEAYSSWSKNSIVRQNATSGGILFEICKSAIHRGFRIMGVRYDYEQDIARHFIFDTIEGLHIATGSKYVQSYTLDALLEMNPNDRFLVIGTPCMIASLRLYLRQKKVESNFILIDFFCHGVPSYIFFRKYITYIRNKIGEITMLKFRSKRDGWQESTAVEAEGTNGSFFAKMSKGDLFFNFFLGNRVLNPVCYDSCKYKTTDSASDLRVGDYWGEKYCNSNEGINSVLVFTAVGKTLLQWISDTCVVNQEPIADVLQGQMKHNAVRAKSYKVVNYMLDKNISIVFIGFVADCIDGWASIPRRVRNKWYRFSKR